MDTNRATQEAPANTSLAIQGASLRATLLARAIDRLSPGKYSIRVTIDEMDAKDWVIEIERAEPIQKLSLARRDYSPE